MEELSKGDMIRPATPLVIMFSMDDAWMLASPLPNWTFTSYPISVRYFVRYSWSFWVLARSWVGRDTPMTFFFELLQPPRAIAAMPRTIHVAISLLVVFFIFFPPLFLVC